MGSVAIVEPGSDPVRLELVQALTRRPAKRHGEELFLQRAVEAFAETVSLRRPYLAAATLNLADGQVGH
jgi:hypothetical protein